MKKRYVTPTSETLSFTTESLMATMSVGVNGKETVGGSKSWSSHKGWNAEDWTATSDGEE